MHRALPSALLCLLVLGVPACEENAGLDSILDEAREALLRGDRGATVLALREARNHTPESVDGWLALVRLYVEAGEATEGLWRAEEGLARFPDATLLRLQLARLALFVRNPSLARTALLPVLEGSPHHGDALVLSAQALLALGDLEAGLATLRRCEASHPDRIDARLLHIATLLTEKRLGAARDAVDRALEEFRDPGSAAARRVFEVVRARLEAQQGNPEAALEVLRRLLDEEPAQVGPVAALAELLLRRGRAENALALVSRALERQPDARLLGATRVRLEVALGRLDEAQVTLRKMAEDTGALGPYLGLANLRLQSGDPEGALAVLEPARPLHPGNPQLALVRAELLVLLDRQRESENVLTEVEEAAPDHPYTEIVRARLELTQGNARAAAARLRRHVARFDRAETQYWLGRALEALRDREGARRRYGLAMIRDLGWAEPKRALLKLAKRRRDWPSVARYARALLRVAPREVAAWVALGEALEQQGLHTESAAVASLMAKRFPDTPLPAVLEARALRGQGRLDDALVRLGQARERFGPSPDLAAENMLTLAMQGRLREAIDAVREALTLATPQDSPRLLWAGASVLFGAGEESEASALVDRALALDPPHLDALLLRCRYRAAASAWQPARGDCQRYVRERPDDANAHFVLGVVKEALSDRSGAIRAYRRAAELDPGAAAALNNLALLLAEGGELDAALDAAGRAYALAPEDLNVLDTLGALYLRHGLVDRSIAFLERAHAGAPNSREPALHLAHAYRKARRHADAQALLEKIENPVDDARVGRVYESSNPLP